MQRSALVRYIGTECVTTRPHAHARTQAHVHTAHDPTATAGGFGRSRGNERCTRARVTLCHRATVGLLDETLMPLCRGDVQRCAPILAEPEPIDVAATVAELLLRY